MAEDFKENIMEPEGEETGREAVSEGFPKKRLKQRTRGTWRKNLPELLMAAGGIFVVMGAFLLVYYLMG